MIYHTKSPSFVYLCWLLVILLDVLKYTPASIPRRRLDLLLNATWYQIFFITGREGWQLGNVLCQKKAWLKKFLNSLYFSSSF